MGLIRKQARFPAGSRQCHEWCAEPEIAVQLEWKPDVRYPHRLRRLDVLKIAATSAVSIFLLSTFAPAFDGAADIRYQADSLRPLNMPPTFDHGYLAIYERGGIGIYAPSGSLQCRIPSPKQGSITSVAIDSDGTIAAAASFGNAAAVWLWNSGGSNIRVINTAEYSPSYVAFAPDGSLWMTGTHGRQTGPATNDYPILRHFSREGELLGAYLRRSSFRTEREPAECITALPAIRVANGRIGMYFPGGSKNQRVWVEADLNGKELGRWLVNIDGYPAAVTETGAVYTRGIGGIHLLDRATGKWTPVSIAPLGDLVGAEGESLVFADPSSPHVYRTATTVR